MASEKNGIIYNSGVSFTGGTNGTTPTGFIVSNGVPTTKRALYLEILPNGYVINNTNDIVIGFQKTLNKRFAGMKIMFGRPIS